MNPTETTLTKLRDAIAGKTVTASEAVRAYLDRIEALEPTIQAFNEVYADRATERAAAVDRGEITGPLAGVPIALKDNMCTTFGRTTCASKILANFESPYDGTVSAKLEAAGAIVIGKTNMDEFAMGSSNETSGYGDAGGPARLSRKQEPYDPRRPAAEAPRRPASNAFFTPVSCRPGRGAARARSRRP